jgi:hypothetical protein
MRLEDQLERYGAALESHLSRADVGIAEPGHASRRRATWRPVTIAAALIVLATIAAIAWRPDSGSRVRATRPSIGAYGFPPMTPLLDDLPPSVADTAVITTSGATLTFRMSPSFSSATLTPAGNAGSGSMSGNPMDDPAVIFGMQGQASNDPAPPRRFIDGVTRAEVARIEWVSRGRTVSVDTVAAHAFPQLRFFLIQDDGTSNWAPGEVALLRAYDRHGKLLTDTARIKAEEQQFQIAMRARLDHLASSAVNCEHATQHLEWPPPEGDSGDGLPPAETATKQAAQTLLDSGELQAKFTPFDARVIDVDGRAWTRSNTGSVQIIRETLYLVDVTLADAGSCPDAPEFYNGVPVTFSYLAA